MPLLYYVVFLRLATLERFLRPVSLTTAAGYQGVPCCLGPRFVRTRLMVSPELGPRVSLCLEPFFGISLVPHTEILEGQMTTHGTRVGEVQRIFLGYLNLGTLAGADLALPAAGSAVDFEAAED